MSTNELLQSLHSRLDRLEAEQAIRACMNRYMALCDVLDAHTPLEELVGLFSEDAIWEGIGKKYAGTFGRLQGREALRGMFAKYMVEPAHFAMNAHFLCSELISLNSADSGTGSWLMLQLSSFSAGGDHLNGARLTVDFRREGKDWRMAHFRTENLFSRPVSPWNADAALPVPR